MRFAMLFALKLSNYALSLEAFFIFEFYYAILIISSTKILVLD